MCIYTKWQRCLIVQLHDTLQFFSEAQTQNVRGFTLPSQQWYIQYYGYLLRFNLHYSPKAVLLSSIRFNSIPTTYTGRYIKVQRIKILYTIQKHMIISKGQIVYLNYYQRNCCYVVMLKFNSSTRQYLVAKKRCSPFGLTHSLLTSICCSSRLIIRDSHIITDPTIITDPGNSQLKPKKNHDCVQEWKIIKERCEKTNLKASSAAGVDITTGCKRVVHKPIAIDKKSLAVVYVVLCWAFATWVLWLACGSRLCISVTLWVYVYIL